MDVLFVNSLETLGMLVLKNILVQHNITAEIYVSTDFNNIINKVLETKPKILNICWNFDHIIYELLFNLDYIKEQLPDIKIMVGGYGATHDTDNLKSIKAIDIITTGETDETILTACNKLLNNEDIITPLVIEPDRLPDLTNYDYDNNILINDNVIYFTISRNCIKCKNKCWYCAGFNKGFRKLDINKVIESVRKKITLETKRLVLSDAEVLSADVNLLYNTFHLPMTCFMMAKDLINLRADVKGCNFIVGVDYYIPDRNGNFIDNEMLKSIKYGAENNVISTSTVYTEDSINNENFQKLVKLLKILEGHHNIEITFSQYSPYPGSVYGYKDNIYKERVDFHKIFNVVGDMNINNTNGKDKDFSTWKEAFNIK